MKSCIEAIRTFFDEKNKAWVTGELEAWLGAAHVDGEAKRGRRLADSIVSKVRSMRHRKRHLLRSHTKVTIQPMEGQNTNQLQHLRVDERVTWVYTDGYDYGVESRIIRHVQQWAQKDGHWMLSHFDESTETKSVRKPEIRANASSPAPAPLRSSRPQGSVVPYDRVKALRYAELWWDGWNPSFPYLDNDCTNFVSQCLLAGQMPMKGGDQRSSGWWCRMGDTTDNEPWSFSWATAHGLYAYLVNKAGGVAISDPKELKIGDVIFYDWDGSGHYHHSTIVTDFDSSGDPLVNAHTDASYHRHYCYLDSRAFTPRTRYRFVHLPDVFY